jgi:hypothetical protein
VYSGAKISPSPLLVLSPTSPGILKFSGIIAINFEHQSIITAAGNLVADSTNNGGDLAILRQQQSNSPQPGEIIHIIICFLMVFMKIV